MENEHRQKFGQRMQEICNDRKAPERPYARENWLAEQMRPFFEITSHAARKWLLGEAYPSPDKAEVLTNWGNVTYEWLMTGRGSKRPGDVPNNVVNESRAHNDYANESVEMSMLKAVFLQLPTDKQMEVIEYAQYQFHRQNDTNTSQKVDRKIPSKSPTRLVTDSKTQSKPPKRKSMHMK
jgi:hypothetical protein